ncbi:MAG: DUF2779 domain-containing protein [Rhodospirillales bacterium]|nr:DUF2779 domain-containing protein [Rhodospirillales bacterium]
MSIERKLSKSQYLMGLECPLSLWFYRAAAQAALDGAPEQDNNKKAARKSDPSRDARIEMGRKVGALAHRYFKNGAEVTAPYDDPELAVEQTRDFIAAGRDVLFEAAAVNPADGSYCSIDVLRKVPGTDEWDMIEVKSATRVKPYHLDDMTFQRHVFEGAGYKIRNCYLMHINRDYRREGALDPQKLFKLQNVNRGISNRTGDFKPRLDKLLQVIDAPVPPLEDKKCSPDKCTKGCWGEVQIPLYSIFNVYGAKGAKAVYDHTGSFAIEDIPEDMKPDDAIKAIELEAHLTGRQHVDKAALNRFLDQVEYPAYFLDYESVQSAIPLYECSGPYQQIPFQFSLHIRQEKGAPLTHISFLHKSTDDPRRAFVETLVKQCGNKGSVIVYYKDFEASRNNELAQEFPEYAEALRAINERMVDIFEPFKQHMIYDPKQNGSMSLKSVLPTYTGLSYDNMEIGNGEQALQEYLSFVLEDTTDPQALQKLWKDLEDYCAQDTYAMVELLDVLYEKAGSRPENKPSFKPR